MSKVTQRSITYVNNTTKPSITSKELDLDTCYGPNDIVIKIHAAALNPVDGLTHAFCGKWTGGSGLKTYGRDFAGTIIRRGANVNEKWAIDAKVNGQFKHMWGEAGTFTNYFICNPDSVRSINIMSKVPKDLTEKYNEFVVSAAWPLVYGTAWSTLFLKNQKWTPESKILVIGASTSVGNAIVQIAKNHLKIGTVVGICNSRAIEHNKAVGYDYLIPYNDPKVSTVEGVQNLVKNELQGDKFDLIFDSVGNSEFFPVMDTVLKSRCSNSQYITIVGDAVMDFTDNSIWGHMTFKPVLRKYNPLRKFNYDLTILENMYEFMDLGARMIEDGTYVPEIDSVFKFADFDQAKEKLDSHKARGKIVLDMQDEW